MDTGTAASTRRGTVAAAPPVRAIIPAHLCSRGADMRRLVVPILAGALASCASAGPAGRPAEPAAAAPLREPTVPQLIAARKAGMHMAATLLAQDVRGAVANNLDVRQHLHEPEGIRRWAAAIPGLFPPGSQGDSRARPEIWRNKADFDAKAAALEAAAAELARRGEAGDAPGYAAQAKLVQAACAACHTAYRSD